MPELTSEEINQAIPGSLCLICKMPQTEKMYSEGSSILKMAEWFPMMF
jgi:hypothetical protein